MSGESAPPLVSLSLNGRRAVITGGASGIGAAAARRFAQLGAVGVIIDCAPAAEVPDEWQEIQADVRDEAQLRRALQQAVECLGGLDAVVAAAGVVPAWQPLPELDLQEFDRVMAINARGVAATMKYAAQALGPGSTIAVVASLNAWRGDPNIAPYVASKHAALGLVRTAALALGGQGIRVNAIAPGPVATEALLDRMAARSARGGLTVDEALAAAEAETALGRLATIDEVVHVLVFLTSELSAGVTGQMLNVDAGIV